MLSKVHSLGLAGIAGYGVETECYIGTGLPAFELVGLCLLYTSDAADE